MAGMPGMAMPKKKSVSWVPGYVQMTEESFTMKVLSFKAAELDKPIFDIFDTDDSLLKLCRQYVATEKAFPSREKLQSFAKDQGQVLNYSAVAPLLKDFTVKLLSGLNGSLVRVEN